MLVCDDHGAMAGGRLAGTVPGAADGFGKLHAIRHAAELSKTPAFWARPAMPLGSHPPQWPARS